MPIFQYGNTALEYSVEINENKKDVSISVEWIDGVKVILPERLNDDQLNGILRKKAPWILNKWRSFSEIEDKPASKEFVSGEKFPYIGRNYKLKVQKVPELKKPNLQFKQGHFISEIPTNITPEQKIEQMYLLFKNWYVNHGKKKVEERLKIYIPKMGVEPSKIDLKEQKLRWGTCTPEGAIYLNWRVAMAPMSIIDYLLVHELAHLKYMNHSRDYWQFVRSILTDYDERKEWLRINGPRLTLT